MTKFALLLCLALLTGTVARAQTPPSPAASSASAPDAAARPEAPASAAPAASLSSIDAQLPPPPVAPPSCAQLTSRALSADLKAATAQSQNQPLQTLVKLYEEAVAQWGAAIATCDGRARERAQRNLADSQKAHDALAEKLQSGSQCEHAHRDATALQELARGAFGERRFAEAASLYRKAEGMWELAAEQCSGSQQQTAQARRELSEIDGHNAEFCAPPFERAREFSGKLRNSGAALPLAERQTQSQIGETLWRDTAAQCRGNAQELATNHAQALARERGTPWVSTPLPGAPPTPKPAPKPAPAPAIAVAAAPKPAAVAPAITKPAAAATVAAATAAVATTPLRQATATPVVPLTTSTAPPTAAPAPETKLFDRTAGDTRYVGQFVRNDDDTVTGTGRVEWKNGDAYEGPLTRSQRHGVGEIRWASGQRYKGEWVNDRATGRGLMAFANGNQFDGTLVDGQPEGEGKLTYASGDVYTGQIRNGLPHGKGSYVWMSGQRYEGDWVHDKPQGVGKMRFSNGNQYEGQLAAGLPQGKGRMIFPSGDIYEGEFDNGKANGQGKYAWKSGERYEGAWARGLKHGHGIFHWPSGDRWEGVFKDDERTEDGHTIRKGH
ncbi:MORN repeat-containing protein [Roseateles sp. LYH14W]|uniref:MORN repeat-containing protein n=1 Tax=Pelomonas parva TaxID=3299032 RepID=A0ABW7F1E1_9BURK